MIIEVTGTNTRNKGAELMLVAIREQLGGHPDVELAVDQFFGSYSDRARHELLQKVTLNGWGRSRVAVQLMPTEFRRAFGLVRDDEVDVLLDASGFAFGDQHPPERAVQFAQRAEAAKRAGVPVILLPQALGPFETPALRDAFRRIVDAATLIFARDDRSMQYAQTAAGERAHLQQAPDFTNLVRPARGAGGDDTDRVCIVPNERMIEKADTEEEKAAYVPFIERCIRAVVDEGLRPVLLLHEQDDIDLIEDIRQHVGGTVPIREEDDPVALKRFLGNSHLVVSSRFHGIVGALSQGVPAIGTEWSHKYEMLFQDYGCADMLLSVFASEEEIRRRVQRAVGEGRQELRSRIDARGEELKSHSRGMWNQVKTAIQLPQVNRGSSNGTPAQTKHEESTRAETDAS